MNLYPGIVITGRGGIIYTIERDVNEYLVYVWAEGNGRGTCSIGRDTLDSIVAADWVKGIVLPFLVEYL